MNLVIRNARVLTLAGARPRRGCELADLGAIPAADVFIVGEQIAAVEPRSPQRPPSPAAGAKEIDARGRVLMPAFIDCHTHTCWAGNRLDEWEQKRAGASYLQILAAGGGIMSTVRAVRQASESELVELMLERLDAMLKGGTTTVEIKSGYGLSIDDELKSLRAIARARQAWAGTIIATALLGHAIDPARPDFIAYTIDEILPAVSAAFPGITIDAYCESGAWPLAQTVQLFERAQELGHPCRVHADQFNDLGMIPEALRLGLRSVDHLEASSPGHLQQLAASRTFGIILPICGFHVDGRYADARALLDAGGALALATNYNPGSAPSHSMPLAIALAARHCGLTPAEAITAATLSAAEVLGLSDRGQIIPGQRADLVLLRHTDERQLAYEVGGNPVDCTLLGGRIAQAASASGAI